MSKRIKELWSLMGKTEYSKEDVLKILKETDKPIKYTFGLGYRSPTIHKIPYTNEQAVKTFTDKSGMCDVDEYEDYIHLNEFSSNDLL